MYFVSSDGNVLTFSVFFDVFITFSVYFTMDKPQIIAHVQKSLNYTLFDAKWIPCSARFVVLGNYAKGTGALQIYEVSHADVKLLKDVSTFLGCKMSYEHYISRCIGHFGTVLSADCSILSY